jgi:hypothetical protein
MGTSGKQRERREGSVWSKHFIYMYENRIMKPVKISSKMGKGIRKNDRGGEFNQSTLYACIGIS